tara:strand:+ start:165 stop:1121 length:957 start_codon:yes stop_codon:yes gene_type:complete
VDNTNLVKLFQAYYNWLYSTRGSFYILDNNFDTLKDLDYCPNELTAYLLSNYLPDSLNLINDLNASYQQGNSNDVVVTSANVRNFLRQIKPRYCDLHGTEAAIKYFCNTLIGASFTEIIKLGENLTVTLYYQDIPTFESKTLSNYLSRYVIPLGLDIDVIIASTNDRSANVQLNSGANEENDFKNTYDLLNKEIPQFNDWEIATFGEGAYDGTGTGEEISIIGNYFPYLLGTTTSIESTAGCSGSTLFNGISGGATGNRNNFTTYAFPDWSDAVKIAGSSFGLINILDFAFLNAASGNASPNDDREISGFCPIGGYAP